MIRSLVLSHVLIDTVTLCNTAVIIAGANVVLNLVAYPFRNAAVNSIPMNIIDTKVGMTALYSTFLWGSTLSAK